MFSMYLIGLREGLEATLVVSILVAYVVKTGRTRALLPMWAGIAVAVGVSFAFAEGLQLVSENLKFKTQEIFEGVASIVAVALVTWMIFWMRKAARSIKKELEGKLEDALALGPTAVVAVAFVAVAREGMETVLILRQNGQSQDSSNLLASPVAGAIYGILTAVVLGYLLYRGAVTLNFRRFFTWTGAALVVVAAGVLRYGLHDLQEAGVLPGGESYAIDVSSTISPSSWYGSVLQGTVNFVPNPTWLEVAGWTFYLVPVMILFLRPPRTGRTPASPPARTEPVTD